MVLLSISSHFFVTGNGFWFQESSNQISFSNKARLFCDMVETCQFLVSCCRIKELSDTSPKSVIQSPWEELQGIVAGIREALHGNRDPGRSDCRVCT